MKKPSRKRLYGIALALMAPAAALLTYDLFNSKGPQEWPHAAIEAAEEVSLSAAYDMLFEPSEGREGAVIGRYIYIGSPANYATETTNSEAEEGHASDDEATGNSANPVDEGAGTPTIKAKLPYPSHDLITSLMADSETPIRVYEHLSFSASWTDRFFQLLPLFLIVAIVLLFFGRGATKSLGLSSAFDIADQDSLKEGFDDVVGIDTARGEIQEIVDFLRNPEKASRLGGRMPKGVLFEGPPGTGKTLLARAMAKEAGVPFLSIKSSGVNQIFVGAGAMKISKAFKEARKMAPCIIFIDEIDAMGRARGSRNSGGSDEKETTLNALLVELDGFDAREGIVLIAATNRSEVLDPALTRRGRIDRKVHIGLPDPKGRREILKVHARSVPLDNPDDLGVIARNTSGFSGADLSALINEAALAATRADRDAVILQDLQYARNKMLIGTSSSARVLGEKDKYITAVHEAGHALTAILCPHADPVEQATILPQGGALGFVLQSPDDDFVFETRQRLKSKLVITVAGRVAEEIVLGADAITSGASSDIDQATMISREMVTRYGMSDQGFVRIDPHDPVLFDPKKPPLNDIRFLIGDARNVAREMIKNNFAIFEQIVEQLKEHETLSGEDLRKIVEAQSS